MRISYLCSQVKSVLIESERMHTIDLKFIWRHIIRAWRYHAGIIKQDYIQIRKIAFSETVLPPHIHSRYNRLFHYFIDFCRITPRYDSDKTSCMEYTESYTAAGNFTAKAQPITGDQIMKHPSAVRGQIGRAECKRDKAIICMPFQKGREIERHLVITYLADI